MVLAARAGDTQAFGTLYEEYYAALVWLAYAVVLDRDWAEDIAQQTFVKACEKLADLRKPELFAGWLTRICRNTAHQALRDRRRRVAPEVDSVAPARDPVGEREQQDVVKAAVERLPAMYREIVVLHYYHHQSYDELQKTLGLSDHSVRGRLFRARKKLEHTLTQQGFGKEQLA